MSVAKTQSPSPALDKRFFLHIVNSGGITEDLTYTAASSHTNTQDPLTNTFPQHTHTHTAHPHPQGPIYILLHHGKYVPIITRILTAYVLLIFHFTSGY